MAKKTTPVDRPKLVQCIQEAEKDGVLANQSELFKKVAELYNATEEGKGITHSIVGLRVKEWDLEVQTPKGRRGLGPMSDEQKAAMQAARGNRKSKAEKFAESDTVQKILSELKEMTPERFHPLVESIRKGSRSAAVKLHCLECSGFQTKEVKLCACNTCPMYLFRPYQGSLEGDEDTEQTEEQAEEVTSG